MKGPLTKQLKLDVDLEYLRIKSIKPLIYDASGMGVDPGFGTIRGNKFIVDKKVPLYSSDAGEYSFKNPSSIFVEIVSYRTVFSKDFGSPSFSSVQAYMKNLLNSIFKSAEKIATMAAPYAERYKSVVRRQSSEKLDNIIKEFVSVVKRLGVVFNDRLSKLIIQNTTAGFNFEFCSEQLKNKGFMKK